MEQLAEEENPADSDEDTENSFKSTWESSPRSPAAESGGDTEETRDKPLCIEKGRRKAQTRQ